MTTTPSTQAMQAAWAAMRGRAVYRHWPQDFDQVMADPICMRLVRLEVAVLSRRRATCTVPTELPYRPHIQGAPTRAAMFDRKRAASGERDDD